MIQKNSHGYGILPIVPIKCFHFALRSYFISKTIRYFLMHPVFDMNPFCHSHLSWNLTVNGLWYAYLDNICQTPSVNWVHAPNPRIFGVAKVSG